MQLIDALFDLSKPFTQPIITIDGPAGAGKTTLAEHLSAALSLKYKCLIIHMDDLYNGWSTPFDEKFTGALSQIVKAHQASEQIPIARFDWVTEKYHAVELLPHAQLLILEGVASSSPLIREKVSASIWIDIDPALGLDRVLHRDGESISGQMQNWLILQEQHFTSNQSQIAADFVLTN